MKVFVFALLLPLVAQEVDVETIVEKAQQAAYYSGKDGSAKVNMVIKDKNGEVRTRDFNILRLNGEGKDQKFYVYFTGPSDVKKMAFMVWKNAAANKDDDRWMWLPALNLVRRIAPGDKRTPFVGSDFTYEDVSGRGLHEDKHELLETTDKAFVVKNTPVKPDSVEFSEYTVWIDKATFLPIKAEYKDKNGKQYRTVEATKVETIDGFPTVIESVVKDLNTGSETTNTFSDIKYNIGLNDRIFSERFLRRPPREVL